MERYIKFILALSLVLLAIVLASMFYGAPKTKPDAPAEKRLNEWSKGAESSQDSAVGELGTISPISDNGSAGGGAGSAGGGGGGESGGGGGTGSNSPTEPEEREPPADLYTAPCGIYFTGYGICNGSCTEGVCTQEGRSCYCKLA